MIRNEASSCPLIFSSTPRVGRAASGVDLAPEPPRATGVGPEARWLLSIFFTFFVFFFEVGQSFNFFFQDRTRFIFAFPGSLHPIWPVLCEIGRLSHKNLRSDNCPISDFLGGRRPISQKRGKHPRKHSITAEKVKNNTPVETLVRPLQHAAAPVLKPLSLPRAPMTLAPTVHFSPIFLTDTENL